jgi:hypothetical protein
MEAQMDELGRHAVMGRGWIGPKYTLSWGRRLASIAHGRQACQPFHRAWINCQHFLQKCEVVYSYAAKSFVLLS